MKLSSKLLVVDDDRVNLMLLSLTLRQHGYEVIEADSGESCLAIATSTPIDIVLLDAMLPDVNGFQCCSILHEKLQERCPPIVIVTGLDDETSINRAFEVKATDYVTKPINFAVLRHRVQRVLEERYLRRELEATNRNLQRMAQTDGLTQLANRVHFEQVLGKEWDRLAVDKQPLGVLLCDLDYFKQYNDTYGHLAGDRCLREVAVVLQISATRPEDVVARYGGEEFIVLLPNTGALGVETVAAQIRYRLTKRALPHSSSRVSDIVTCSLGGAVTIPQDTRNPESLIMTADEALYEAKTGGRNRLVLSTLEP